MPSLVRSSPATKGLDAAKKDTSRGPRRRASVTGHHQPAVNGYSILPRKRFWEVRAPSGELVCLTVYKRGAEEVIRRLGFT